MIESFSPIPDNDLDLFNFLKQELKEPPADEEEAMLTPEQLVKKRDPEGIFSHPFESKVVQEALATIRQEYEQEKARGEFYKIYRLYQETLEEINKIPVEKSIHDLKITLIYANRSNPSEDKIKIVTVSAKN